MAGRSSLVGLLTMLLAAGCGGGVAEVPAALDHAVAVRASGCSTVELTGAGAVIGPELVATAAHVVAGSRSIVTTGPDGVERPGELVGLDTERDVALVAVAGLDVAPLLVAPLAEGDEGEYVTFDQDRRPVVEPFTVVRPVNISISDIFDEGDHRRPGYEILADVDPGDSGAVLVRAADGAAGAIVFASSRRAADRAWATDLSVLEPLLAAVDPAAPRPVAPGPCLP